MFSPVISKVAQPMKFRGKHSLEELFGNLFLTLVNIFKWELNSFKSLIPIGAGYFKIQP